MIKKIIIISVIFGVLLPSFSFGQPQPVTPQRNLEEIKGMGEKFGETAKKELPGSLKRLWQEEVLPIWQKMYNWFKRTILDPYIAPFLKKEMEQRKPVVEEEFKKEKKEMKKEIKTEIPRVFKNLWEKFKELVK